MARVGLDRAAVIESAFEILDADGPESLSLAAIARAIGVRTPSLYNHVGGIDDVRASLVAQSKTQLAAVLTQAVTGRAGADAIRHLAFAYRQWALDFPHRHSLTLAPARSGDHDDQVASDALIDLVVAALRQFALDDETLIDAIRMIRALLQGFASLEGGGAFALDRPVDTSFQRAVDALIAVFGDWSGQ